MIYIIIAICFILIIALVAIESHRELNKIRISRYDLSGNNIPESLKHKKMVFISDYHEACDGRNNPRIISLIDKESPDFVLVGGDMTNGNESLQTEVPSIGLINSLAENHTLYYTYGNHEKRIVDDYYGIGVLWEDYLSKLSDKVHILLNDSANLTEDGSAVLYGLDLPLEYYNRISYPKLDKTRLDDLIGERDKKKFAIVMGHSPDFIKGYAEWGADLVLSGHFHGGLIRFPLLGGFISPRLRLFPRYDYGLYEVDDTRMIVTNGLGQHSVKVRVNNIPEIVVINFN